MYRFRKYVLLNLVMLSIGNKCQEMQYEYMIEVPKFQCDKKESLKTGVTTIRLQGKDAQKLQYEFKVNYKNITMCNESQRCTLTAWRAVRNLEKHLQNICASQKNLQEININNTLLIPGIEYVLNVKVANNGINIDNKEFLLECTNNNSTTLNNNNNNGSATHFEQTSHTSLVLLGSNITYRDLIYFLNAQAVDCNNNCSYYFKWEILDNSEKFIINDPTKGSELQISFETLNKSDQYIIRCSLMSLQKNIMIATALQNVNVAKRGMILKLAISTMVIGLKKPFQLHAYIKDVDNTEGKINIEWSCKFENRKQCLGFDKNPASYQEKLHKITLESNGFVVVGRYNITVIVKKGNITKQESCEIRVEANGFAEIDVDIIDELIDPSQSIEIPVYVSNLIANCMLQWKSIKTANYDYIDLEKIPGNINVITNITLTEDEFLNEIDEFSNDTTDIDYNLKIPASKGNWKGLKGNASYLFRLNVTCPVIHTEDYDNVEDAEPLLLQNFVTLYADVIVKIDPLPILNSLEVTPKQGIALKTLFKFIYHANGNMVDDGPVLYKFGYFLNNEIIFVSNLLGVTNTKSVLPYTDSGVKTVLEGCNSYSLCAQIFGPVIITEIPIVSEEDQNNLKEQLNALMIREEYYKFFTYSVAILQTYNNTNDETVLKVMQNYISNLTSNEIKRLLMLSADGETKWRVPANNLIKNVGILLKNFPASGILLNNIVALRNELSRRNTLKLRFDRSIVKYRPGKLRRAKEIKRFKRDLEKMTLDEVKSYLVISELIIMTSPDKKRVRQERENLLNQINKFMHGLCATLYEKSQTMNLELRTMIISVEKINKNTFNRYTHILYDGNSWNTNGRIKLGKCFTEKLNSNTQLCLGKAVLKNYLNKKGIVYMIKIYSADSEEQMFFEDRVCDSVLILPVDEKQLLGKEARCALWKRRWVQTECKTLQVTTNIQCNCNNLGYYAVEYVVPEPTTTTTTTTTTIAPVEIEITTTTIETSTPAVTTTSTDKDMLNEEETTTTLELSTFFYNNDSIIETSSNLGVTNNNISLESTTNDPIGDFPGPTTIDMTNLEVLSTVDDFFTVNESANVTILYASADENAVIYYCIIGFSIAGIAMLMYGIKQLLLNRDENAIPNNNKFPKYALIPHPEMLQDLPPNST